MECVDNDNEMKQGSAKGGKVTTSRKNLTSQSDDDDAASLKPKAGTIHGKPKKTAICKKPAASDALHSAASSPKARL